MDKEKNEEEYLFSVPVTDKKEGQSPIYRHPQSKDCLLSLPQKYKSLIDFWDETIANYGQKKALEQNTYIEMDRSVKKIGSWLTQSNHKIVYLYSKNCPQWLMTDFACWNYGQINIPLYDTLGSDSLKYIIQFCQGTAIFTTSSIVPKILENLQKNIFKIRELIIIDQVQVDLRQKAQKLGLKITLFSDILLNDKILDRPQLNLQSVLTYIFTSGTTGLPKGVVYTHKMVASSFYPYYPQNKGQNVHLSYLPLAHIFQRFASWLKIYTGSIIYFMNLPITQLMKQIARVRPTAFPIVPRLLKRLYLVLKPMYEKDKNKQPIKAMFGGRLRSIVCASAAIPIQVLQFFKEVLQAQIAEGYGQTQTTGPAFATKPGQFTPGYICQPHRYMEWKIIDVPQLDYYTNNDPPRGQLLMRGDNVFKQYFKQPERTKQTVDQEGWNHSGDIVEITKNGKIRIIDRKTNVYKLSQGQYVAPQKVQGSYGKLKYIAQCYIYGDSTRDYNIGIVHPNLDILPMLSKSIGIEQSDPKILCENSQINSFILSEMIKQGKADGLNGFEQAKKIELIPTPFMQLGILTNTMKLQRNIAKKVLKEQIQKIYDKQ